MKYLFSFLLIFLIFSCDRSINSINDSNFNSFVTDTSTFHQILINNRINVDDIDNFDSSWIYLVPSQDILNRFPVSLFKIKVVGTDQNDFIISNDLWIYSTSLKM